jgi:hypothetical protein
MDSLTHIPFPDWNSLQPLAKEEVAAGVQEFQNKAATAFCEIAIHAWRMQRRMTDRMSKEVKEEHKAMHRSVAGILETLAGMGCTLRDR